MATAGLAADGRGHAHWGTDYAVAAGKGGIVLELDDAIAELNAVDRPDRRSGQRIGGVAPRHKRLAVLRGGALSRRHGASPMSGLCKKSAGNV